MMTNVVDPLAYAADADPTTLEDVARLDSLRVRKPYGVSKCQMASFFVIVSLRASTNTVRLCPI